MNPNRNSNPYPNPNPNPSLTPNPNPTPTPTPNPNPNPNSYSADCHDETPLYLFDKHFAAKAPELAAEYVTPAYFAPERDLFARLPSDCRPDYRWLIVGGTRSGSGWHVDPNASSAWNAVIRGSKKWILTPPGRPPPGITASDDGATVTAPVSLYEWYHPNPNPHHKPEP